VEKALTRTSKARIAWILLRIEIENYSHHHDNGNISNGVLRVELSFFEPFDRGARVTRVTMHTARYLALGKFF
jgi:hypothetical protein